MTDYLDYSGLEQYHENLQDVIDGKQDTLVSGTNIKTVNNESILGSGDLTISGGSQSTWYGTCSTPIAGSTKIVECEGFTLQTGAIIGVLFTQAGAVASGIPVLNINSTGTKSIYHGTSTRPFYWDPNTLVYFMYDGTGYQWLGSTQGGSVIPAKGSGVWWSTSPTAASTANKSFAANLMFRNAEIGSLFIITSTYGNTADAPTLVSQPIYYKNAVVSANNPLYWDAGETLIFVYDGTYFRYLGKDTDGEGGSSGDYLPTVNPTVEPDEYGYANILLNDNYASISDGTDSTTDPTSPLRTLSMAIAKGSDADAPEVAAKVYAIDDQYSEAASVTAGSDGNVVIDAIGNLEVAVDTVLISGDTSATVEAPTVTISGSGQNGSASMTASSVSMTGNSAFVGGNTATMQGSTVTVAAVGSGSTTTVSSAGTTTVNGNTLSLNATGSNSTATLSGYTLELLATNYTIANPSAFLSALGLASASGVSF